MTVQEYVDQVLAGELFDPTLSFQLKEGFVVRGLLQDYLDGQCVRQLGDPDRVGKPRLSPVDQSQEMLQ